MGLLNIPHLGQQALEMVDVIVPRLPHLRRHELFHAHDQHRRHEQPGRADALAGEARGAPGNPGRNRLGGERRREDGGVGGRREQPRAGQAGGQRGGAALDAILAALPRCGEAGRWNEGQREMAELYVMTQLGREEMLRHYAAQNVDLTFIDAMVAAATPDSPPPFEEMAARVRAQGVTGERTDSAEDIAYLYLELMARAEAILAGFPDIARAPR